MHLVYIDDSKDEKYCVFSAILIPEDAWQSSFNAIKAHRRALRQSDGILMSRELHAWEFVSGRGRISDRIVGKGRRCMLFAETLALLSRLPSVRIINGALAGKNESRLFERLLNRIQRNMVGCGDRALLICDEGKESDYTRMARKMRVFNPIPSAFGSWGDGRTTRNLTLDRIVEDPWFKSSKQSYFIQMADFVAYSLLRRENQLPSKNKYNLHKAFDVLRPALVLEANSRDPDGVIRG